MKLNSQNIFSKTDQKILWDDHLKGFGVRIYKSDKRSFIIQIRDRSKRQFKRTIGNINIISLKQARDERNKLIECPTCEGTGWL
ncbi:integrase arm-type DNA-binding domain-containing protein [Alphaproteobacteria bacterium]|nr:integrase arm-type DNA-binding domain-containing protein [Alphaproteobacteria bacterium]